MITAPILLALALAPSAVSKQAQDDYSFILKHYVKAGRVDYAGIEEKALPKLDGYLANIADAKLPKARSARIAFLIDAYNALVIKAVIKHGRPRSVLDVKGFFDADIHTVAGQKVTLDALEKKVLNPFAKDPRTHFVLVCGAVGCPILESRPFVGTNVEKRLERATRRYLRSPHGARSEGGQLRLSKIFDWYAADFGGPSGVRDFVVPRLPEDVQKALDPSSELAYIDYNWTLNQQ